MAERLKKYDELDNEAARLLYSGLHTAVNGLGRSLVKYRVEGAEHIPQEGGAIILLNHLGKLDVLFGPAAIPDRHITVIGRQKMMSLPVLGPLFGFVGAETIKRPMAGERFDRDSLRTMRKVAKEGRLELLYGSPNTRTPGYKPSEPLRGIAAISQFAKVPVVPGIIHGTDRLRKGVTVKFAPALPYPQDRREHEALIDEAWRIQTELFDSVPDPDGYYKNPKPGQFDIDKPDNRFSIPIRLFHR